MSYVSPNSTVMLCKDVPLDPSYRNTIYFSGDGFQYAYFLTKVYNMYSNNSYQRVHKGVMRLEVPADNIYDCNYMMFQNSAFGSKWFYAFITKVEYVNNATSEIYYQLDVMQTWMFEAELQQCYVEREHSESDEIGDNITPEGLECGEYIINSYEEMSADIDDTEVGLHELGVIVNICDVDGGSTDINIVDGIMNGGIYYGFKQNDVSGVASLISQYVEAGRPDAVIGMYMCPILAMGFIPDSGGTDCGQSLVSHSYAWTLDAISESDNLDGYTPKNNKMYTYPYSFIAIDNSTGESLICRYEFFDDLTPVFSIRCNITYPVMPICKAMNYEFNGINATNHTQNITLSQYPQCSWNADYYTAWVAQNSIPLALNTAKNVIGVVGSALSGNLSGVVSGGVGTITDLLSSGYTASIKADVSYGSVNAGNVNCSGNAQTFHAGRYSISKQYAEMIDNYFTKFGYATRKVKVPNRNVRPHWTYTKTVDCLITGNVPSDDRVDIENIYNAGITFWINGDEVGDYTLDNTV